MAHAFHERHVDYCVAWGTHLGYVRGQDIIEGDMDIDFYVNVQNYNHVLDIFEANEFGILFNNNVNNLPEWPEEAVMGYGGALHSKWYLCGWKDYDDQRSMVDIYFYEEHDDYLREYWNRGEFGWRGGAWEPFMTKEWLIANKRVLHLPKNIFLPFKNGNMCGCKVKVPNDSIEVVKFYYGERYKEEMEEFSDYIIETKDNKSHIVYKEEGRFFITY